VRPKVVSQGSEEKAQDTEPLHFPQTSLLPRTTNCAFFLDAIAQYRREWDDKKGMFKEKPLHDWTSHAADVHRYAAVAEDRMKNQTFSLPPTTGLVQPYYPKLGV
jgi:hypothetical protein